MDQEMTIQQKQELQTVLLNLVDLYVRKEYLSELEYAQVKPLSPKQSLIEPGKNMRLFHLNTIAYEDGANVSEKVHSIFSSISQNGSSTILLIDGKKDCVDLYLGVADEQRDYLTQQKKVFSSAFQTAFLGADYTNLTTKSNCELVKNIFPEGEDFCVSAVSGAQLETQQGNTSTENLGVLIDAMKHKPFSAIILSQAMQHQQLVAMRRQLEDYYTNISPFQKQDVSMSRNESNNYGLSFSSSVTESQSHTEGTNTSYTHTEGQSTGEQTMPDRSEDERRRAQSSLIGTGVTLAATLLTGGMAGAAQAGLVPLFQSLFYSRSIGDALGNISTLKDGKKEPDKQESHGTTINDAQSQGVQQNDTQSHTEARTDGVNISKGVGNSNSCQVSFINKSVVELLNIIDDQIHELSLAEKNGAFNTGAYFIAGDEETAVTAANVYRSIVSSHGHHTTPSKVYWWSDTQQVNQICDYLKRGIHPVFSFSADDHSLQYPDVTLAQPIRLQDMPAYYCIPQRTIHGVNVVEHAAFPRDIVFRNTGAASEEEMVNIGNIYHMGKEDKKINVDISLNGLTKHLFVAGTTGSGKSNFCYGLIDSIINKNKKVLIIEPAKGEYGKVFGGRDDFEVYGTNAQQTKLLRINPFAFPRGITVDEHIESLMNIFNNSWPMYSAMPAVLKDALETIYRNNGFDMEYQTYCEDAEFPCFADLLEVLPSVIKNSEYSKEVQGNYIGALSTRIKSLTNGVYSTIFCKNEIDEATLFDSNVIIDISRTRSDETKALIMGVLVNRLSEYRTCSGVMNSPLKHITLLEEAHHLLKMPHSNGVEGANIGVASVEMISNAIAEMRTYGEGFIIADQSPAIMDKSVMRNTFTKVFFNLPELEDRIVAAGSLELNKQQQAELSRIDTGVAVVYHRAWAEPVLAKIRYYSPEEMKPYCHREIDIIQENRQLFGQAIAVLLFERMKEKKKKSSFDEKIIEQLQNNDHSWLGDREPVLNRVFENRQELMIKKNAAGDVYEVYRLFFSFEHQMAQYTQTVDIQKWVDQIVFEIMRKADISEDEVHELLGLLIICQKSKNSNALKLYGDYKTMLAAK